MARYIFSFLVLPIVTASIGIKSASADDTGVCNSLPEKVRQLASGESISIADAAREIVHANSERAEGDGFVTATDPFEIVERLCRASEGRASRPLLLCGHRAEALQALLDRMGVRTRIVYLFSAWDGTGRLYGHALIEALDPLTGRWHAQDPDYNIAFENTRGRRLSIAEIVAEGHRDRLVPRNLSSKGWGETGGESLLLANYYSVAYVPASGMLYYDSAGGETGLVTRVGEFIQENMPGPGFVSALLGSPI